jgi:hypothetical protein
MTCLRHFRPWLIMAGANAAARVSLFGERLTALRFLANA